MPFISNFSIVQWHWKIKIKFGLQEKVEMTLLTTNRLCEFFKLGNLPVSQEDPTKPGMQMHVWLLGSLTQVPLLRHGSLKHSSTDQWEHMGTDQWEHNSVVYSTFGRSVRCNDAFEMQPEFQMREVDDWIKLKWINYIENNLVQLMLYFIHEKLF